MNKTKIVATIGPSSQDMSILREIIKSGIDVVRLNLSHATHAFCDDVISKVKTINKELNTNIAIMIDTKGPDIRMGSFSGGSAFLKKGNKIRIYMKDLLGDDTKFSVDYANFINDVSYNNIVKVNDGHISLKVIEKDVDSVICEVLNEGYVYNNKGVNVPGIKMNRPFLSVKDIEDIKYASKAKVDFIALSFVSSADDVLDANDLLISLGNDHIGLIAKIENERALDDIDDIIRLSDGIMVARGDLGAEIPAEKIPGIQKKIIARAHDLGKVSIVATEMLASMERSSTPTRAEVSDVANAVLDGTDAVMLSGETTIGKYPVATIQMMEKIITSAEQDINYIDFLDRTMRTEKQDTTGLISYSVAESAIRLKCKAIVTPTLSGYTAKKMSRFRPICPIIAISPNIDTIRSLSLHFGVYGVLVDPFDSFDSIQKLSKEKAKEIIDYEAGDRIIITGGYPVRMAKSTNFMHIEEL